MASEVDICNLALGHLGDRATVASINPPEGSAQAEHCARFYAIARDTLLESHTWGFATKRTTLAQVAAPWTEWDYAYAFPADAIRPLAVLDQTSTDDYAVAAADGYAPKPYACEIDSSGNRVIYTDQQDAVLRYVARITDPTKFSPLFVEALSWKLASMLAGPVIKGDAGAAESKRCMAMVQAILAQAQPSDANQQRTERNHNVPWIARR